MLTSNLIIPIKQQHLQQWATSKHSNWQFEQDILSTENITLKIRKQKYKIKQIELTLTFCCFDFRKQYLLPAQTKKKQILAQSTIIIHVKTKVRNNLKTKVSKRI